MATYRIGKLTFDADDAELQRLLPQVHADKVRPLCCCKAPGVEMYVAKVNGKFIVKRMPDTGGDHTPSCDSYEPPPELSGLGQVMGSAIQEDPDEGVTALKLDFSLTKTPGRSAPVPTGAEVDSVKTDGTKLTLRSLLHLLWESAGFNRWTPAMAGKRSWWVIRRHLLTAAEDKAAKGASLHDVLFIPESFNLERKDEIAQRRMAQMMRIAAPQKGTRRLMVAIGEVKEIAQSRFGHKIVLKHLGDCPLMLNDDLHKRLLKRFEVELGLWDALEGTHLVMIGTFGVSTNGVASLEEVALMNVTDQWVPFESTFDKMLLDALSKEHRRYVKGLRYNLASSKPLACAVLSDTTPPSALYVVPPNASEDFQHELEQLIEDSKLQSWTWDAASGEMPALPEPGPRSGNAPATRPAQPAPASAPAPADRPSPDDVEPPWLSAPPEPAQQATPADAADPHQASLI